jgi:cytochrome c553
MRKFRRIAGYAAGIIAVLVLGAFSTAYTVSGRKLAETFDIELTTVPVPEDESAIAWGDHLVNAVTGCQDCHGPRLEGSVLSDDAVAVMAAPNLTAGRGGIGAEFSDEDWVRAIRHGVRRDGRSLIVMPSYAYAHLSDSDLGSMIAYLKQVPPMDNELPPFRLRPLGRALVAAGAFDEEFVAHKVPRRSEYDAVEPGVSLEYGEYLATVGGCRSCHRPDLKGGPAGPPDAPPAADISPEALAAWTEADFLRAMREGRRPDGSEISDFMPWRAMGQMTDDELSAIWLYMQSVGQ